MPHEKKENIIQRDAVTNEYLMIYLAVLCNKKKINVF